MSAIRSFKVMARWAGRRAVWMVLIALAAPVWAQDDFIGKMERQVEEIVSRSKPAVVSVRVGPRRPEKAFAPHGADVLFETPLLFDEGVKADIFLAANGNEKNKPSFFAPAQGKPGFAWDNGKLMEMLSPVRVGTGFLVDRDGVVLTTADVVGDSKEVQVTLADGREVTGRVLGADMPTGVAALKVEVNDAPALRLAEGDAPKAGGWAIIIGNQLERSHSVWVGTIARTDVAIPTNFPQGNLLQINAPVGPGASGAPVLNSSGQVIGVVVASAGPALQFGNAGEWEKFGQQMAEWGEKFGEKVKPDEAAMERHAKEIERAAERIGKKAEALAKQREKEATRGRKESAAEQEKRQRQQEEMERRLEEWGAQLEEKLEAHGEKIGAIAEKLGEKQAERAELAAELRAPDGGDKPAAGKDRLRRLEGEIQRLKQQLMREHQGMTQELGKINALLPNIPGMREIAVELAPEIAKVVAAAQAIAMEAVKPVLEAEPADLPIPPVPPVPDAAPEAAPAPAPEAVAAPAEAPHPLAAPAPTPAAVAAPAPEVRIWTGHAPGGGASTYAIPAATVRWAAAQLRERGRVAHPHIGIQLSELRPDERDRLNAPAEARVQINGVMPDSPAQKAGLQKGDVILEFQGKKLDGGGEVIELMRSVKVGDQVPITIWRNGERRTVTVAVGERPRADIRLEGQPFRRFEGQPFPRVPNPPSAPFILTPPRVEGPRGRRLDIRPPRATRIFTSGQVRVRAEGSGRGAKVTLEAQEAELQAVLQELSRATGLTLRADEGVSRKPITLRVESVPLDDLLESMNRLYQLRSERRGNTTTFRAR
jgi:S1-C subfamily serine protease